jgi:integrase/recombinase XerD
MQQEIDRFLRFLSSDMASSQNTVAAYRNDLTQLRLFLESPISSLLGSNGDAAPVVEWSAVTRNRIISFVVHLREKSYAPTTVARKVAAVKSFFHFLTAEGIVSEDPTDNLDSPRVEKVLPRSLNPDEVGCLLSAASRDDSPEGLRDDAMLQLLWSTGMRVSELVSLNVDDLDLSTGYVRCLGKANRERIVPVSQDAKVALEEYIEAGRPALVRRREESALFVNHRGERLTRQGFWLILKSYARGAGLPSDITPQTLRHSFAVHQLDQHTDLRSLQELLGHASIATTQVYAQVVNSRQPVREAVTV